ncbi:MAG TPA: hypothetical protein VEU30_02115 [Thermoanaerobaculia bacterium]|nr:hypothetical protein [Thermoanaerobaculia bacterium]
MAKTIITTDFPTPEEVAAYLGIPDKRVAELNALFDEYQKTKATKKNAKRKASSRAKKK